MPASAKVDRAVVEEFLFAEADMLDQGEYRRWLGLFAATGVYWVPAAPAQLDPLDHVSIIHETRDLLGMRIERLMDPAAHALARPIRTSRIVGNIRLVESSSAALVVTSRFHLLEWQDERRRAFAGRYRHRLEWRDGGLSIAEKRVELIDAEGAFETIQLIF
jgi:benzoate/toluate 1,2-dioxygenase beta subunit